MAAAEGRELDLEAAGLLIQPDINRDQALAAQFRSHQLVVFGSERAGAGLAIGGYGAEKESRRHGYRGAEKGDRLLCPLP